LRELAKLAAKFKPDDWKELLKLLPPPASRGKAVSSVTAKQTKRGRKAQKGRSRVKAKTTKRTGTRTKPKEAKPQSQRPVEVTWKSVSLRKLKFAYSQLFREKETPETRRLLIAKLHERLAQLSTAKRKEALSLLFEENDASENYRQWLRIIAK
jgi:hypothetical protein